MAAKVGYMFSRGAKRRVILDLVSGLMPPEALHTVEPGRVVQLWDNALLATRRKELLRAGRFVSKNEVAESDQGGGGRRGRIRNSRHFAAGAGRDVYAGGRKRHTQPAVRCRMFVPHSHITTKTWADVVALIRRHDAAPDARQLARLKPGDPVPLRETLPRQLVRTLEEHGSLEYRAA